jgi:YHS domain-containing protein
MIAIALSMWATVVFAQSGVPPSEQHQHETGSPTTNAEGADMSMLMREGSGTSWLPDASPRYMVHLQRGPWMLMGHNNLFIQFLHESGRRGANQTGSINWVMGMADRNVAKGHLQLRAMFSVEPWTIGGCGYPDLLASGEQCRGETIHDRQHPHDLPMEMSAEYDAPLRGTMRWQIYGGPAGEPALGPVAYPHRVSAMPNPIAPITHHWLDSTHISFGVVTGGVYGKRWKVEASAFNGREPDEKRKDLDFAALDSVSGRVWLLPIPSLALQFSAGRLKEAEAGEGIEPRRDVNKVTASVTYHRVGGRTAWASTLSWGRNSELEHGTDAFLAETNFTLADRDTWFGRFELAGKTAHDLDIHRFVQTCTDCIDLETFAVSKLQGGYTRYVGLRGLRAGVGGVISAGIVPTELRFAYGSRVNTGIGVFLTLRPAAMSLDALAGHTGEASAGGPTMVMVQTAFDPSKLTCASPVNLETASKTTYEGKTYYFCSAADRDKFLADPKMSLSMMPPKQ